MNSYFVRNVNEAMAVIMDDIDKLGIVKDSRNGKVLKFIGPVTLTYDKPIERVLFSPMRNANPFFHFFESLWMLGGRNDVDFVAMFVNRMRSFSDDDETLNGAYGFRWREHFGYDQLAAVVQGLKSNPDSRRCVVAMWDATSPSDVGMSDLEAATSGSKDVPCNTHIYFEVEDGVLNMTVCNRSNDVYWGMLGANVVHMSMLQEYMAGAIGVPVGQYTQFANNAHVYLDVVPHENLLTLANDAAVHNFYKRFDPTYSHVPLIADDETMADFDADLDLFFGLFDSGQFNADAQGYCTKFFKTVVLPMQQLYINVMNNVAPSQLDYFVNNVAAADWRIACEAWAQRRHARLAAKGKA